MIRNDNQYEKNYIYTDLFDECRINRASDPYDGDDREPGDTNVFKGKRKIFMYVNLPLCQNSD